MLFLAKYHRSPGYSDGSIYIGLIEAENKDAATLQVARLFAPKLLIRLDEEEYWEDKEDFETPEEIAQFQIRLKEWKEKTLKQLQDQQKEEIEKNISKISVAPIGTMMHLQTIPTTYRDY